MRMRIGIGSALVALALAFGVVSVATPAQAVPSSGTAAFGTPIIDGTADAVWDSAAPIEFNTTGLDDVASSPISATVRFLWDAKYVYVLTQVSDSTPYSNDPDATGSQLCHLNTLNDAVDVWVNWTNNADASYTANTATGVGVIRSGEAYANGNPCDATATDLSTIKTAVTSTDTGYTVEVAMPWPTSVVRPGSPIGINVSANDVSADNNTRTSWITWDTTHNYWDTPTGIPTVTPAANPDGSIFSGADTFDVTLGQAAFLPVAPDIAPGDIAYSVSGSSASVNSSTGQVTGLELGTATITATTAGHPADQLTVNTVVPPGPVGFISRTFTFTGDPLANGAQVNRSIAAYWRGTNPATFSKAGGDDWLSISAAGVVSGTVPTPVPDHTGVLVVQGTDGTVTDTFTVLVPLVARGTDHFLVPTLTTPAASASHPVHQSVGGLWTGSSATTYTKVGGDPWLAVSPNGVVTGTPPTTTPGIGLITVQATDGVSVDAITVEVPVLTKGQRPSITTASWNLWDDGTHVDDSLAKELSAITGSGLEVIGVQESNGAGAKQLADALGWYSYQSSGDLGLVSAYPISNVTQPTTAAPAASATITVDGEPTRVWVAHLDESDYGPDRAAAGATDLVSHELTTTRYAQATAIATEMAPDLANSGATPVILLGDLASPSKADSGIAWPVPDVFAKAGLTDSGVRTGPTFSLASAAGATDRVDYVDYQGHLKVLDSEAYYTGWPSPTDGTSSGWPSDHAAAVTLLQLQQPVKH